MLQMQLNICPQAIDRLLIGEWDNPRHEQAKRFAKRYQHYLHQGMPPVD